MTWIYKAKRKDSKAKILKEVVDKEDEKEEERKESVTEPIKASYNSDQSSQNIKSKSEYKKYNRDYSQILKYKTKSLMVCPLCRTEAHYSVCPEHWFRFGRTIPAVRKEV